jgi:hypothetical protein
MYVCCQGVQLRPPGHPNHDIIEEIITVLSFQW